LSGSGWMTSMRLQGLTKASTGKKPIVYKKSGSYGTGSITMQMI
jgi:hypothetical protein